MLSTALAVISIFLLVPLIIAFFAVRGYRQIARREREEAAEQQALPAESEPAEETPRGRAP